MMKLLSVHPALCVCMVKHHYPELLGDEPEWFRRATELAPRVYELSQYLVDVLKKSFPFITLLTSLSNAGTAKGKLYRVG